MNEEYHQLLHEAVYDFCKSIANANNSTIDQQPTIKRPRKGSGGVHAKQQHSQQSPHHGTNHKDVVSIKLD